MTFILAGFLAFIGLKAGKAAGAQWPEYVGRGGAQKDLTVEESGKKLTMTNLFALLIGVGLLFVNSLLGLFVIAVAAGWSYQGQSQPYMTVFTSLVLSFVLIGIAACVASGEPASPEGLKMTKAKWKGLSARQRARYTSQFGSPVPGSGPDVGAGSGTAL
uniref:Uncharacterized protein n=1 Tax=viral metagenome TaxID=1070528 RepID=A0A2V0RJX0_9ZZZZ